MEIIAELFLGLTNAENCSISVDLLGNPMAVGIADPAGRHVSDSHICPSGAYVLCGISL